MSLSSVMAQPRLPLPNPGEWITIAAAAYVLGMHKRSVVRMTETGRLALYRPTGAPGERTAPMLWRPDVDDVLSARTRLKRPADAR